MRAYRGKKCKGGGKTPEQAGERGEQTVENKTGERKREVSCKMGNKREACRMDSDVGKAAGCLRRGGGVCRGREGIQSVEKQDSDGQENWDPEAA